MVQILRIITWTCLIIGGTLGVWWFILYSKKLTGEAPQWVTEAIVMQVAILIGTSIVALTLIGLLQGLSRLSRGKRV